MPGSVIKVLFNVLADAGNFNAQSLNAREIAIRLDPTHFHSTLFFERSPDPRLLRPGITLVKLPDRRKTLRLLREMLRGHNFIVYIDLSPASYLYLHLPRLLRRSTQSVLCIEGTRGNLIGVSPRVRRYADYVARHADFRTAISDYVAHDFEDLTGIKPDLIMPVGVDTRVFSTPARRNHAVPTILFVGHLIERKGAHLVFDAAQRLPHAQFHMIGDARDDFGRKLLSRHKEAKLSNVKIEPPVPQDQLAQAMRDSDILVLPSRIEGMPKVTLEAAATGLPCVVFRDYQTPSVVDRVTGFQVGTFDEMLECLQLLIQDAELRQKLGAAAAAHAAQFDWDHVAARWASTLQARSQG